MTISSPPSLIVIDDDPMYHRLLQQKLRQQPVYGEISYSLSGRDVLEVLTAQRGNPAFLPDMIFLDLDMPDLCGHSFLQFFDFLYASLAKKIRVFIISSSVDISDRLNCRTYTFVEGFFDKASGLEFALQLPRFAGNDQGIFSPV